MSDPSSPSARSVPSPLKAKRDLTRGPIFGHLWRMALPMFLGLMAHMLLNVVDGIFVARLGLSEALAVLNYGFPLFYLFFAVFNGLSGGTTSILARLIGAREKERAEQTLAQVMYSGLGLFLIFLAIFPLIVDPYLRLLEAPPESAALAKSYLTLMLFSLPMTLISLLLGSGLRAEGNMRSLANALVIGTLTNIVLDPFFIFESFHFAGIRFAGLGWGVVGAASATLLSNFLTMTLLIAVYLRGKSLLRWTFKPGWGWRAGLVDAFSVGFPSMLSQSLIGVNLILMTKLAAAFGETAASAIGIGARLDTIAVFPALAIMTAVVSLVGQNYGAKDYDRVKHSLRVGLLTAFVSLSILGLIIFFLRGALVGLFQPDATTRAAAEHYVMVLSLGYGFLGIGVVASGTFQGLGRGWPYLFLTFCRLALVSLPLAWLLSRHTDLGEYGLHYAPFLANLFAAVVASLWAWAAVSRLELKNPIPDTESPR